MTFWTIESDLVISRVFMKTPEKGASLAANMLQMGSIYGQVSSPSPQQMQPPFYDSNPSVQGATGWV